MDRHCRCCTRDWVFSEQSGDCGVFLPDFNESRIVLYFARVSIKLAFEGSQKIDVCEGVRACVGSICVIAV